MLIFLPLNNNIKKNKHKKNPAKLKKFVY